MQQSLITDTVYFCQEKTLRFCFHEGQVIFVTKGGSITYINECVFVSVCIINVGVALLHIVHLQGSDLPAPV